MRADYLQRVLHQQFVHVQKLATQTLVAMGVDISHVDPRAFESPIFGHGQIVGEVCVVDNLLSS